MQSPYHKRGLSLLLLLPPFPSGHITILGMQSSSVLSTCLPTSSQTLPISHQTSLYALPQILHPPPVNSLHPCKLPHPLSLVLTHLQSLLFIFQIRLSFRSHAGITATKCISCKLFTFRIRSAFKALFWNITRTTTGILPQWMLLERVSCLLNKWPKLLKK